jgi:hypothetical protein
LRRSKAALYLGLALVLFLGVDWVISRLPFAEAVKDDLTELQTKQIDIFVATTQQLLAFSSLVLAGVGLFASSEGDQAPAPKARALLVWVAVLSAFSIYMGYLRLEYTVWMLGHSFVNLRWAPLFWLGILQFWSFVGSVALFAWMWLTREAY